MTLRIGMAVQALLGEADSAAGPADCALPWAAVRSCYQVDRRLPANMRRERALPWWLPEDVVPQPAPPLDAADCLATGQWVALPADPPLTLIRSVVAWQGALWVAGFGGAAQWQPPAQQWLPQNEGLPPPQWGTAPYGIVLATPGERLWLIQGNAGPDRLLWREAADDSWHWMDDAPLNARSLLVTGGQLYLGSSDGVAQWEGATGSFLPLTDPLGAMVTTLAVEPDDGALYAGTANGGLWLVDPLTQTGWPVGNGFGGSFIHALHRFGEYLYVATQGGLHRCWDFAAQCEPIEPETGFAPADIPIALAVWQNVLLVGTSHGAYHFDAANDFWNPLNTGLTPLPVPIEALLADASLYAASPTSVWHWRCGE